LYVLRKLREEIGTEDTAAPSAKEGGMEGLFCATLCFGAVSKLQTLTITAFTVACTKVCMCKSYSFRLYSSMAYTAIHTRGERKDFTQLLLTLTEN